MPPLVFVVVVEVPVVCGVHTAQQTASFQSEDKWHTDINFNANNVHRLKGTSNDKTSFIILKYLDFNNKNMKK